MCKNMWSFLKWLFNMNTKVPKEHSPLCNCSPCQAYNLQGDPCNVANLPTGYG